MEGMKLHSTNPSLLPHGGLSVVDARDGTTPMCKLLQPLMGIGSQWRFSSWLMVDLCVQHAGIATVVSDFLTSFPQQHTCLSLTHLQKVDEMLRRYRHLISDLTNEEYYILFQAYEKLCHFGLQFPDAGTAGGCHGAYFAQVYEMCFQKYNNITLDQITFCQGGETNNIFIHAIECGLPWLGLQYMVRDSQKVISERRNVYSLPASLFAASVGKDLDTVYELLQRGSGLFESALALYDR